MTSTTTPTRRNATRQDIQHIADMLACLNVEGDGAAQILEAMHGSMKNSFYYALPHTPMAAIAGDMHERIAEFNRPRVGVINCKARAAAEAFGAGLDPLSLEQGEPA